MEKLNLYNKKVRVVSLKSAIAFLIIMLLPSIGGYIFLSHLHKHTIGKIKVRHAEIIKKLRLDITGSKDDIDNIENLIRDYNTRFVVLTRQRKDIIDFLKSAYTTKKVLREVFKNFEKTEDNWMILSKMLMNPDRMSLHIYEIYTNRRKSDDMVKALRSLGNVKENVLFDVFTTEGKKMSRVVIDFVSH